MSNKVNNIPQHKTIQATPSTPDTGFGKIYIKNDKLWYGLDDLGVETLLSGGGGGGGIALIDLSAVLPLTYNNSTGSFSINQSSGLANGYLSSTDWNTFNNKVSQINGMENFVTKFTSNSSLITASHIYDNGTCLAIGYGPTAVSSHKFSVNGEGSNASNGGYFINDNVLADSTGYGLVGASIKTTGTNIGVSGRAITGNTGTNIGIIGTAEGGASNYAIQLVDGTQAIAGRFLKNIVDGKANWANITAADVAGTVGVTTGTNNYVAKFTPNGTTIGNSQIRDDGTKIGINSAPEVGSKIYIISDQTTGINLNSNVSNINTAVGINLSVSGTNNLANTGIVSTVSGGNSATIGVQGSASSSTGVNKGIEGIASGTSTNIGLRGYAVGGSSNYSIQLQDGTQTVAGRFLKNMNTSGQANWSNITAADVSGVQGSLTLTTIGSSGEATLVGTTLNIPQYSGGGSGGVSGSGTLNLIPKWTPDGTTLGDSQINDDATRIWIGQYSGGVKFNVYNNDSSLTYGGAFESRVPGGGIGLIAYGQSSDGLGSTRGMIVRGQQGQTNTGLDAGAFGTGLTNTGASLSAWGATENIGAYISAYGNTGTKIGAQIIAQGTGTLYSVQLQDGTEGAGKFLKSVTSNGKAQWSNITSSDTQGASGSFVSNDGKTITVTNGLITSIV